MRKPTYMRITTGGDYSEEQSSKRSSSMIMTALVSLFAVLFISLFSCQNHKAPSPDSARFRVKKVSVTGNRETSYTTFAYKDDGRLASIYKAYTRRASGGTIDTYYTSVLGYDARGRVASFNIEPDYKAPGTVSPATYTYEYDDKGAIMTINYVLNPPSPSRKQSYQVMYAGLSKFPSRIKSVDEDSNEYEVYDYTYAGGNVVAIKKSSSTTALPEFNYTRTYRFDDKPNPFYGLYPGIPSPDLFNSIKQNAFFENDTFSQNNALLPGYTYEYDSHGNLIKSTGSFNTIYEYEPY